MSNLKYPADLAVTVQDFQASGWQQALDGVQRFTDYWTSLSRAAELASSGADAKKTKVLWLLADAASMRLIPASTNQPFDAMLRTQDRRSALPDDFTADDIAFFNDALPHVADARLRARLADLVWLRKGGPRGPSAALTAIDAYRETSLTPDGWLDGGRQSWSRALRLALSLRTAAGTRFAEMEFAMRAAFDAADWPNGRFFAHSLAKVMHEYKVSENDRPAVAAKLAALGAEAEAAGHFQGAGTYFDAASSWYAAAGDKVSAARMTAAHAESWVKQAEGRGERGSQPSALVAAKFYENAIQVLRDVERPQRAVLRVDERIEELRFLQIDAGERSLGEMGLVRTPGVSIEDLVRSSRQAVAGKPVLEAFADFCSLYEGVDLERAREGVLQRMRDSPLQALFGKTILSRDGRVIAKRPAMGMDVQLSPSDEESIFAGMVEEHMLLLQFVVQGQIVPAWQQLTLEHRVPEGEFLELARNASIVPKGRAALFAKGLYAGYDGDFVTALHVLVPQLEHLVRHHLKAAGAITAHLDPEGLEKEVGLSSLMEMPEAGKVFGAPLCFEIKAVFCSAYGPNLRNELAHGLLDDEACLSIPGVYAWWFMFRLVFVDFWNSQHQSLAAALAQDRERQQAQAAAQADAEVGGASSAPPAPSESR
ncbi:DUF4209 domain-containing protein [Alicycliphilus denitrificans]|uniref:DUF4209 domain-containing protein n=1 Tax=Alicycliphilus denitrificans TaxID=179636 RepID=UPI0001F696C0|nr:DUF4209 domain-containing protein [Alicycliphilus denitrificans]ADU98490.1 hypothetical protein Alide_0722 [Alicycliphilus denitrificans BC]GAO26466.1 hypothetical protein ALISP_6286 [Alicycliphilus sp. B1]